MREKLNEKGIKQRKRILRSAREWKRERNEKARK